MLVFRWLGEPVEVSVDAPRGAVELRLGVPHRRGAALAWDGRQLTFTVCGVQHEPMELAGGPPGRLALTYANGRYHAMADDRPLGPGTAGPAPMPPAALTLEPGASMGRLLCAAADGETREVTGRAPPPGFRLTGWALLTTAVGLIWFHARRRSAPDTGRVTLPRVAGVAVGVALLAGLPAALERRNAARMDTHGLTATAPLSLPVARSVSPGSPYELGDRRDGDLRLSATIVLQERTALDLLLRADLPRIDRQVLVTLSSDPALPSGMSVNLGTSLRTQAAPVGHTLLEAGRPLRLVVECRDQYSSASVDGVLLGEVSDFDLRSGRTAFHALSGGATVSELRIEPLQAPRSLASVLRSWKIGTFAGVMLALALLAWSLRRGARGWLWAWPLAAMALPVAPEALAEPALALAALWLVHDVIVKAGSGASAPRRLLALPAGAVLLCASAWVGSEKPAEISPVLLNALRPSDIAGAPLPAAYAWARHPLCRRFNGYLKTQTFREEAVPLRAPPGTLRVVALGSSSTFGYGVAVGEAWPAQLEALLAERSPGRTVDVVNAGVPGVTAERMRPFLEGVLLPLQPDVVVIDLGFNDHTIGAQADERAHFRAMTTRGIGPIERRWRQHLEARSSRLHSAVLGRHQRGDADEAEVDRLLRAPALRYADSLRDMVSACHAAGAEVLLVQEPMRPSENRTNIAVYDAAMATVASELGLGLISPQAALDQLGDGCYLDIVHPRAVGHGIIAREVADALEAGGLLDG